MHSEFENPLHDGAVEVAIDFVFAASTVDGQTTQAHSKQEHGRWLWNRIGARRNVRTDHRNGVVAFALTAAFTFAARARIALVWSAFVAAMKVPFIRAAGLVACRDVVIRRRKISVAIRAASESEEGGDNRCAKNPHGRGVVWWCESIVKVARF